MNIKINKLIKRNSYNKIFFITGKKTYKSYGLKKKIINNYKKNKIKIFVKKEFIPQFSELKNILKAIKKFKPDLLIAIGGGCVIDYAKISSISSNKKININNIINYSTNDLPIHLIAVPTTAGSGAEVTSNAVIYYKKKKFSVEGNELLPKYFFLDYNFLRKCPKSIRISSGFDAISQSIESLFSIKSNRKSIFFAKKSLKILFANYLNYVHKPNFTNTMNMANGANLSGKAINISKTIAVHALSYPLTSQYKLPHGISVALFLNSILEYNFLNYKKFKIPFNIVNRYKILFKLTKTKNINNLLNYIDEIKVKAGIGKNLSFYRINIKKNSKIFFSGINKKRLKNNPLLLSKKNINEILMSIK